MKRFAGLFEAIDHTTSTNAKVGAIVAYLVSARRASRLDPIDSLRYE